jgi:hypothetical protein
MANLFNNDIGLNYKGLINIGSTINQNISGSLQYLTDGDGNNLPIQVSTSAVRFGGSTGLNWDDTNNRLGIGTATPLGILHLKTTATTTRLLLDGDAAQSKIITYRTNGLQRFGLYTNATAESGANAGSDFALRSYNDAGSLLSTPLFIKRSTGHVGINQPVPTASLQVRGDGTNNIFIAENNAGTARLSIPNIGAITTNSDITIPEGNFFRSGSATFSGINSLAALYFASNSANGRVGVSTSGVFMDYGGTAKSNTSGTIALTTLTSGFAAAAGSANFRPLSIAYTINNSGAQTGAATGIFLNATETNLNSMTHNLMDLQVGGVSALTMSTVGLAIRGGSTTSNRILSVFNAANTTGWFTRAGDMVIQYSGYNYAIESVSSGNMILFRPGAASGSVRVSQGLGLIVGADISPTARLHVRGDGTNPIARFEGSAGTGTFVMDAAGNNITHTAASTQGSFTLQASHRQTLFISATSYTTFGIGVAPVNSSGLNITNGNLTVTYLTYANMNGADFYNQRNLMSFVQSSGSVNFESIGLFNTINQTGGANGITRGVYVAPTLTSAADFRAIDVLAGSTSAHKLIRLANAAGSKVFEVNAAQEIGLFGVTPIAQPTTGIAGATVTAGGGAPVLEDDLFAGYTVAQIAQALVNLGILKP